MLEEKVFGSLSVRKKAPFCLKRELWRIRGGGIGSDDRRGNFLTTKKWDSNFPNGRAWIPPSPKRIEQFRVPRIQSFERQSKESFSLQN